MVQALELMGIADSPDLVTSETTTVAESMESVWWDVRRRFNIDAIFFRDGIPLLFFKQLPDLRHEDIVELHRRLWNYNVAPLLAIVFPTEIRIYNCFQAPSRTGEVTGLVGSLDLLADALEIAERYRLGTADSELGMLDQWLSQVNNRRRVDRYLLNNLRVLRTQLEDSGLERRFANRLIMRCIFVRYLEDNALLRPAIGYPTEPFVQLLTRGEGSVYAFFHQLAQKFNGDVIPVDTAEENAVKSRQLNLVAAFLAAADLASGQSQFWAYDFSSIPVELISSMYEEFMSGDQRELGAYYTPPAVVEFMLDEVLPPSDYEMKTVLDPACGSGIFLLNAYKRLVARWRRANKRQPNFHELSAILSQHVFGVWPPYLP